MDCKMSEHSFIKGQCFFNTTYTKWSVLHNWVRKTCNTGELCQLISPDFGLYKLTAPRKEESIEKISYKFRPLFWESKGSVALQRHHQDKHLIREYTHHQTATRGSNRLRVRTRLSQKECSASLFWQVSCGHGFDTNARELFSSCVSYLILIVRFHHGGKTNRSYRSVCASLTLVYYSLYPLLLIV
jgi:hypothetical protein